MISAFCAFVRIVAYFIVNCGLFKISLAMTRSQFFSLTSGKNLARSRSPYFSLATTCSHFCFGVQPWSHQVNNYQVF